MLCNLVGCAAMLGRACAPTAARPAVHVTVHAPPALVGADGSEGQREAQQQLADALSRALEAAEAK